jgi:hypothetical protein
MLLSVTLKRSPQRIDFEVKFHQSVQAMILKGEVPHEQLRALVEERKPRGFIAADLDLGIYSIRASPVPQRAFFLRFDKVLPLLKTQVAEALAHSPVNRTKVEALTLILILNSGLEAK